MNSVQDGIDALVQAYYSGTDEGDRLTTRSAGGRVEFARIVQLVTGRLAPHSRVLDVGGATGVHARWLADAGHTVTLVDPVPSQVAEAARAGTFSALVGDARRLDVPDASMDAVLLFGPLYHLHDRADRVAALREARRVLAPGGVVMAQGVGRLAAFTDRVVTGGFDTLGDADLDIARTGRWASTSGGFPGGHFHTPAELADEAEAAGLTVERVVGVEGPNAGALEWFPADASLEEVGVALAGRVDDLLDAIADPDQRRRRQLAVAALSAHVLVIATAP